MSKREASSLCLEEDGEEPPRKKFEQGAQLPTLEDHLLQLPSDVLDGVIIDDHLVKLSHFVVDWRDLSPYIQLTKPEETAITNTFPPLTFERQRFEALRKWKEKAGQHATYRSLIKALHDAQRANLIDELCRIVSAPFTSTLNQFHSNDTSGITDHNHRQPITRDAYSSNIFYSNCGESISIATEHQSEHVTSFDSNNAVPNDLAYYYTHTPGNNMWSLGDQRDHTQLQYPIHNTHLPSLYSRLPHFPINSHQRVDGWRESHNIYPSVTSPMLYQCQSRFTAPNALPFSQTLCPADAFAVPPSNSSQSRILALPSSYSRQWSTSYSPCMNVNTHMSSTIINPASPAAENQVTKQHNTRILHNSDSASLLIPIDSMNTTAQCMSVNTNDQISHSAHLQPPHEQHVRVSSDFEPHSISQQNIPVIQPTDLYVESGIKQPKQALCTMQSLPSDDQFEKVASKVIKKYGSYLRKRYRTQAATSTRPDQWPPAITNKVFKLALIEKEKVQAGRIKDKYVRLTITGMLDDILQMKVPIELPNILDTESLSFEDNDEIEGIHADVMEYKIRKVVLLEGTPGSGKSTLCLHICQKWEAGELFQEYDAVILVRLRDPLIHKATAISDLLPRRDQAMSEEVASAIVEKDGKGILWILDGWDEFPLHLQQDSIVRKLIQAELTEQGPVLHESSVIIASRPISSGNLYPLVSARVEVLGFTKTERKRFYKEALSGNTKAVKELQDKIEENPTVESSCYLPLNAAIMLLLYKCSEDQSLPNTHYGIFSALVCNSILRHFKERMHIKIIRLVSLDQMPSFAQQPFQSLCKLAYHGVMDNKVTFSKSDIAVDPDHQELNTLGLLQGVESLVSAGKDVYYNFLHLSIQELLAAFYIATEKCPEEQVSNFKEMFNQARFIAVFRFYAAITKLQTPGINDVITGIVQSGKEKLLISLLNCLYEVQDQSLCKSVSEQLGGKLDLKSTSLSSVDCLSVGYFLSAVCVTTSGEFEASLKRCSIDKESCKFLIRGLSRCLDPDVLPTAKLNLNLNENGLTSDGVMEVAQLLQNSNIIHKLDLQSSTNNHRYGSVKAAKSIFNAVQENPTLVELDLSYWDVKMNEECGLALTNLLKGNQTLKALNLYRWNLGDVGASAIGNGLNHNSTLKTLDLKFCSIGAQGMEVLSSGLVVNTTLETLNVGNNNSIGDEGIEHVGNVLKHNSSLKHLNLEFCGITAQGMEVLSSGLMVNTTLETLGIEYNNIGDEGVEHVGNALQQNNSLKKLDVFGCHITDKGVEYLAKSLATNESLRELFLQDNGDISKDGLSILTENLKSNLTLIKLRVPLKFRSSAGDIERVINEERKRRGLPDSSILECVTDY